MDLSRSNRIRVALSFIIGNSVASNSSVPRRKEQPIPRHFIQRS